MSAPKLLITADQARAHVRTDEDTPDFDMKVAAASARVLKYLGAQAEAFLDTNGDVPLDSAGLPDVPYEVYAGTCLMFGYLYRLRDESTDFVDGFLPPAVMAVLYASRDPVFS
jgi:hypothetical protein